MEYLITMDLQTKLRIILQQELLARKSKNPRYSTRGFASHLQIDHSLLNKFLRGQKQIGQKNLISICKKLRLQEALKHEIENKFRMPNEKRQLDIKDKELLQEWYYYPILEWMTVHKRKPRTATIAKQLGITAEECKTAVHDLLKSGIFVPTEHDGLHVNFDFIVNFHNAEIIKKHQRDFLKKSHAAIDLWSADKRVNLSLTVGIDVTQLPLFQTEIRKLLRRINRMATARKRVNGIYQMQISLFPHLLLGQND